LVLDLLDADAEEALDDDDDDDDDAKDDEGVGAEEDVLSEDFVPRDEVGAAVVVLAAFVLVPFPWELLLEGGVDVISKLNTLVRSEF